MILTQTKTPVARTLEAEEVSVPLTREMLKSLCFNCDNRRHCIWKEERKVTCEHFE
ncbi:hypothetical protein [Salinimicrobium marinum]|uniref:hypothetical protein n=1 Tax=Salinimicrobium marinum TaxID=680283 RepID=UPI0016786428|nr:hypothetical protein [Salinimicrobium marinum]